jgi:hypothetical protein
VGGDTTVIAVWEDIVVTGDIEGKDLVYNNGVYTLPENRVSAPEGQRFGGWLVNGILQNPGVAVDVNNDLAEEPAYISSSSARKDYRGALRFLDKAGDLPEAKYARGALEIYMDNPEAAKPHLIEAQNLGVAEAEEVLREIAKNRNIYRMSDRER